jgi:hypothetical protein
MRIRAGLVRSAIIAWFGLGGCGGIQAPQLEALQRDMDVDQRARVRAYDSCRARSSTPQDLDDCMRGEGYRFVSASAQDYRASECWDDRYAKTFPKAFCFEKH